MEIINKQSCILLIDTRNFFINATKTFAEQYFNVVKVVLADENNVNEDELASLNADYVFSFLSNRILRGALIKNTTINFHPAPPEWPGRGAASYAIFYESEFYGATAHIVEKGIDTGAILKTKLFPIYKNETCESLFQRGEQACLDLYYEILYYIYENKQVPLPNGEKWLRKAKKKKELLDWMVLDSSNEVEFEKKIKACKHSKFPGPFVFVNGHKFGLINE